MVPVTFLLVLAALVCTLVNAMRGNCPLWIPVFLLTLVHLLGMLPIVIR